MRSNNLHSASIRHLSKTDPVLAKLIRQAGPCKLRKHRGGFETLAEIIVAQQLSTVVATAIFKRLRLSAGGRLTPEIVLGLSDEQMRKSGLSRGKMAYLRDLAKLTLKGTVNFRKLPRLSDAGVIDMLTQVKGIGRWTAQMYLLFVLGRPDVFSSGDKGIQTAVMRLYKITDPKADLDEFAARWQPYRSTACWYLWRSLDFARKKKSTTGEAGRYTQE